MFVGITSHELGDLAINNTRIKLDIVIDRRTGAY